MKYTVAPHSSFLDREGWRHDGRFDFETSKFETFPRREIGLGVLETGLCLYNDGSFRSWGPYSSTSSVV